MNVEQMIDALSAEGWDLWHLGVNTKGVWCCRLYDPHHGRRVLGNRGIAGFELPCWREGYGPTMAAAIGAASAGLFSQPKMEDDLDLAHMLS